jgi:hypothetical protein
VQYIWRSLLPAMHVPLYHLLVDINPSLLESCNMANGLGCNHSDLVSRCAKIGRPLHRCSQAFFNDLVVKLYTVHVMPG